MVWRQTSRLSSIGSVYRSGSRLRSRTSVSRSSKCFPRADPLPLVEDRHRHAVQRAFERGFVQPLHPVEKHRFLCFLEG
jgi:hypothetical protein